VTIRTSPCDWAVQFPPDCAVPEPYASLPATGQGLYDQMAVDFLWRWTGRRFSVCEVTVRPCRERCWDGESTFGSITARRPFTPALIRGEWFNIACGSCGDTCGCGDTPALKLPGPVEEVTEITIDGEVLDPGAYRVDNHSLLVRVDGDRWPTCQNMTGTLDDPDSFGITYSVGIPVPVGGQVAAGVLAGELAKAACGDSSCALPKRLQAITRQGVTVGFMDAFEDLKTGGTGIWLVDSWVTSVTRAPQAPRVFSPDVPRDRFRRTTSGA
jgi:hypothetical protein